MSLTANALANLLWSYSFQQDGTSAVDVSTANANQQNWLALCITQAIQEMHGMKPDAWRQRPGITLLGPQTGTVTVTNGSTACTLGTLVPPYDGCTLQMEGSQDNELNYNPKTSLWVLRRPHDGPTGTISGNLYMDCWVATDGTAFENVLGDVLANGIPIITARTMKEVEMCRWMYPWWDYGAGYVQTRKRFAGRVLAVVMEPWVSPWTNLMENRLRFTPMPFGQTVIDANLQVAAQVITVANMLATGGSAVNFWTPALLDESILADIALKRFSKSPWFRTESARKGIAEDYALACDRLRNFRGQQEAQASIEIRGW